MRSTITVTDLYSTRGRVDVLRVLWWSQNPLTAADISRHANLTYPAAAAVLDHLVELGVVGRSPAGRGHAHWLIRENEYVRAFVDPVFRDETAMPDRLEDHLRSLFGDSVLSLVLFGSYARGDQTIESDVDVIAIAHSADEKKRLERDMHNTVRNFSQHWGAPLSVITYDPAEAADLESRAPQLYDSLRNDGVVVSGLAVWEWSRIGSE